MGRRFAADTYSRGFGVLHPEVELEEQIGVAALVSGRYQAANPAVEDDTGEGVHLDAGLDAVGLVIHHFPVRI